LKNIIYEVRRKNRMREGKMTEEEVEQTPNIVDIALRYDEKLAEYVIRKRLYKNRENTSWKFCNNKYRKRHGG
jgi:hypothetical protein